MTAQLGVAAAFKLTWNELSSSAQELGCLLSIFDIVPLPWNLIEQCATNCNSEELENARDDELLDFHLLQHEGKGIYKLHELIREFFQSKLVKLLQAESLQQAVTLRIAAIARQNPLLAHEILDKKLLGWQWVSDVTQLSAVEWGWQVRTVTQAWIDGLGALAHLLFPLQEDNRLPVMRVSVRQDGVDIMGKPTGHLEKFIKKRLGLRLM